MSETRGTKVTLDSLVGLHVLDAVDRSTEKVKRWDQFEDADAIRFRLDGKVYTAVEDPSDGYRSCMDRLFVSEDKIVNVFPPCNVLAVKSVGTYDTNDTLDLIDCITGKTVLRVGTDHCDDYYPCFVSEFTPESMAVNATKERK